MGRSLRLTGKVKCQIATILAKEYLKMALKTGAWGLAEIRAKIYTGVDRGRSVLWLQV